MTAVAVEHTRTHTHSLTHSLTHTHTLSLSLSLSRTQRRGSTHIHKHTYVRSGELGSYTHTPAHTLTAEDGDLAVKAAQRVAYDVILMDGFMPNKTGWEATIDIRADETAKGVDVAARCVGCKNVNILHNLTFYMGNFDI
jgi:CheY-like chemotaxis protein